MKVAVKVISLSQHLSLYILFIYLYLEKKKVFNGFPLMSWCKTLVLH